MSAGRYLVMERDPLVLASLVRAITRLGGAVETAPDRERARALLETGSFSAIFLDAALVTDGDDVLDLLARARERQPRARRVLMKGGAGPAAGVIHRALAEELAHELVEKPFGWPLIERLVRHAERS